MRYILYKKYDYYALIVPNSHIYSRYAIHSNLLNFLTC